MSFFDLLGFLTVSLVMAIGIFWGYTACFDSPQEAWLRKENSLLRFHYDQIRQEIDKSNEVLPHLQDQDASLYRIILEVEPITYPVRKVVISDTDRYQDLVDKNKLIATTVQKVDRLKQQLYIQSKSYDEIQKLAQENESRLAAIPAIQPLSNKD